MPRKVFLLGGGAEVREAGLEMAGAVAGRRGEPLWLRCLSRAVGRGTEEQLGDEKRGLSNWGQDLLCVPMPVGL